MNELMYSQSSLAIVTGLLVCMLLSMELGYRIGRRKSIAASKTAALPRKCGSWP